MTACPYPIAALLPHAAPMVLLDRVTAWDDDGLTASVTITPATQFATPDRGVAAHIGVEWMAQACGAFAGLQAKATGLPCDWGSCLAPGILPLIARGSRPGRRWRYRCGACSLKPAWRCSTAKSMLEKQLARGPG